MKKKNIEYMIIMKGVNIWCDELVLSANYADNKTVYFSVNGKLIASYCRHDYELKHHHSFNDNVMGNKVIVFNLVEVVK